MRKKQKLLIIGYFGFSNNQIDGQTIKTRNVRDLIMSNGNDYHVDYYDTQEFQTSRLSIVKMFTKLWNAEILIYLPGQRNLKRIFPLIYLIVQLRKISITYIAIGGWLHDYLEQNPSLRKKFGNFKSILVESDALCNVLTNNFAFKNVQTLPNFRVHNFIPRAVQNDSYKVVFMARVSKFKGIELIFEYADYIERNKERYTKNIEIDFYGPIDHADSKYFSDRLSHFSNVNYRGIIEPELVFRTLNKYDVLVLPTHYQGEGFPGTILDAYIAGVPVVVSNWKFLPEFVDHGISGFVFDLDQKADFFKYLDILEADHSLLSEMKKNAQLKSNQYSSTVAWQIIRPNL